MQIGLFTPLVKKKKSFLWEEYGEMELLSSSDTFITFFKRLI